jgi:hypothetical protein
MPAMPRINNKMRKIAYDILGLPDNISKVHKKTNLNHEDAKSSGLDADDRGWERQQWIPTISGTIKQKNNGPWL